jgi:two-component system, OmpR family, sensor histidine kinase BaeS
VNRLAARLLLAMLAVALVALLAVPVAVAVAERATLAALPPAFRARVETVDPAPFVARWRLDRRVEVVRPLPGGAGDAATLRSDVERLFAFVSDSRAARREAIAIAVGLSLAVGAALAVALSRSIARPIAAVSAATSELAAGRFGVRVALPRYADQPDETRALSDGFNAMAAAIERYEGERKAMVADVAHELRTPLAAMRMRLEALADGLVPFEPAEVELLRSQTDLMGRLIDDLRLLSLADAGRLTLEPTVVDVGPWLARTVEAARPGLEALGVRVEVAPPDPPVALRADPQRLAQILQNLLANAAAFSPQGAVVEVRAESDAAEVRIGVRDRGPGVPPDELDTIFERFVQGRRRDERGTGGTGLGLAIVRTLVGLHGGRVTVRNLPMVDGGGAEFTVVLPQGGARAA